MYFWIVDVMLSCCVVEEDLVVCNKKKKEKKVKILVNGINIVNFIIDYMRRILVEFFNIII